MPTRCLLLLLAAVLGACTNAPPAAPDATNLIVVRHAEKAADPSRDPELTTAGEQRAARLAGLLAGEPLEAAYSTDFQRTRRTAQPAADAHGLDVAIYDAEQPAAEFAASLKQRHPGESVLVVGHSNTVPDIVAALCACDVAPIDESQYDNLYRVRIQPGAKPVLTHERY